MERNGKKYCHHDVLCFHLDTHIDGDAGLGESDNLGVLAGHISEKRSKICSLSLRRHNCSHRILYMSGIGHERKFSGIYIRLGGLGVAISVPLLPVSLFLPYHMLHIQ